MTNFPGQHRPLARLAGIGKFVRFEIADSATQPFLEQFQNFLHAVNAHRLQFAGAAVAIDQPSTGLLPRVRRRKHALLQVEGFEHLLVLGLFQQFVEGGQIGEIYVERRQIVKDRTRGRDRCGWHRRRWRS